MEKRQNTKCIDSPCDFFNDEILLWLLLLGLPTKQKVLSHFNKPVSRKGTQFEESNTRVYLCLAFSTFESPCQQKKSSSIWNFGVVCARKSCNYRENLHTHTHTELYTIHMLHSFDETFMLGQSGCLAKSLLKDKLLMCRSGCIHLSHVLRQNHASLYRVMVLNSKSNLLAMKHRLAAWPCQPED